MNPTLTGPSMLALCGDMHGPALWRCLLPFTALEQRGYPCGWDVTGAPGLGAIVNDYDGFLLPRMSWPPEQRRLAEAWFGTIRASGRFVVYECDDDVLTADLTRRAVELGFDEGKTYARLEAERAARIWAMQQCDGVTVSTQPLALLVRSYTDRPVIVVPNAIDLPWFRRVLRAATRQTAPPTIGWAGGRRPGRDLAAMAEGWRRVAARCPAVTFVVQGDVPDVLVAAVPDDRLVVLPWLPLERYPAALTNVDIGCCAVEPTRFNSYKSPIKCYEYAVAGAAVVATSTVYGQTIEHGRTGFIAETPDEWAYALAVLIERPALRSMLATRLLKVVERTCSLAENLWRWPDAWAMIAEDARARRGRLVAR